MNRRNHLLDQSVYRDCLRWLYSTLLVFILLFGAESVQALPESTKQYTPSLFSLSLEEVLNIRVDGKAWDERSNNSKGIFILDRAQFYRAIRKEQLAFSHEDPLRTTLLVIDGYEVGPLDSVEDLSRYVRYFKRHTQKIELYRGDSALLWSGGRAEEIFNIVTERPKTRAVIRGGVQ